jgi:hypothetical protein
LKGVNDANGRDSKGLNIEGKVSRDVTREGTDMKDEVHSGDETNSEHREELHGSDEVRSSVSVDARYRSNGDSELRLLEDSIPGDEEIEENIGGTADLSDDDDDGDDEADKTERDEMEMSESSYEDSHSGEDADAKGRASKREAGD